MNKIDNVKIIHLQKNSMTTSQIRFYKNNIV